MEAEDIDAVANLFQRSLRKTNEPAGDDLKRYLAGLFLTVAARERGVCTRVHVREDGTVSGLLGVLPVDMVFEGRRLLAANCVAFINGDRDNDPFVGARLLREVLSGPQDLSFSDTANDLSTSIWRTARATVLGTCSLEWVRILKPAAFALDVAGRRFAYAKLAKPLSKMADAVICRRGKRQAWLYYAPFAGKADAFIDEPATDDAFIDGCRQLVQRFPLRPSWDRPVLETIVQHAARKALYGTRVQHAVKSRSGRVIGVYLYYGNSGGSGRVVQIMAEPDHETIVIDCLIRNAYERGLVAVRGRTDSLLLQAMIGKQCAFKEASSTVVHSRDPALLAAMTSGKALLNGLAGEEWTRLMGDRFA